MRASVARKAVILGTRSRTIGPASYLSARSQSTDAAPPSEPATAALSSRWLSDTKQRIGKCITFGLQPEQTIEAAGILQEIARDWRELVAGSEGFLTTPQRRGLFRRRVIWGEQDAMGHVNNVLYNRYAETGRIEWVQNYAKYIDPKNAEAWSNLMRPTDIGLILRKITTEFKFPMQYPDHITVLHRLGTEVKPGTDAFLFEVVILSELHQRPAARVTEDCVFYDYQKGKKTTLKPFMIDILQDTWRLQEEAKRINSDRVRGLLGRVRKLETDSWDREGAVEDMGSQK